MLEGFKLDGIRDDDVGTFYFIISIDRHLGSATGHDYFPVGVQAICPSNCVPTFGLGGGGYRTGVDHIDVGRRIKGNDVKAGFLEGFQDFLSFVLVDFAAQGCEGGRRHQPNCTGVPS